MVINVKFDNHSVQNVFVKYVQYLFSPLKEQTTEGTPQRFDRERPLKAWEQEVFYPSGRIFCE